MEERTPRTIAVAIIGGDGRIVPSIAGAVLEGFASTGDGGHARQRSAVAAIRGGAFALVVVAVRWVAHGDSERVRRACRSRGVPCRFVTGRSSALARVVRAFVAGGPHVR